MGKALTVFVILNLIVSAAVVTLGALSFMDRRVAKGQVLELRSTAQAVSEQLGWGEEVAWETEAERKALPFSPARPASPDELASLEDDLEELVRFATQRQAQLNQRYMEYVSTREREQESEQTLAARTEELSAAREQEGKLKRELAREESQLQEAKAKLDSVDKSLEGEIERKNTRITELNNELASLEVDLETRIQERDLARAEYERCNAKLADDESASDDVRGAKAMVLAMNKDWEYVIIDKGQKDDIQPELEAFVHRDREYVGKLQIVRVEDTVSVARIVPGSVVDPEGIRPGDRLFF